MLRKFFQFSLILFILGDIFAIFFLVYLNIASLKAADSDSEKVIEFRVESGEGASQITANLKRGGIIANEFVFKYYLWKTKSANLLKAGKYEFSPSMTPSEIVKVLVEGGVKQDEEFLGVKVVLPEGYSTSEIETALIAAGLKIQRSELIEAAQVSGNLAYELFGYRFLKELPSRATIDGFLFPDTYFFDKESTLNNIVGKMLGNFDEKITDAMRVKYKARGKNLYEIVIMASLLEKEVRTLEDMKIVSGILWKRMEIGMPLQIDATLAYLTGKKTGEITDDDKLIDSPYNTYAFRGLPPAPISNPGLNAIEAAIEPSASDYLYYLSTPQGETIFSKTNEEHNENRAKYLK